QCAGPPPIHASAGLLPRRAAAQPALRVSVTVAVGAGAGWWSIVFGSVLTGSVSGFSSSVSPFLNDLMPLAKSPISSEILPRPPNRRRTMTPTTTQCQRLNPPISNPPHRRGPRAAHHVHRFDRQVRLRTHQKQGLRQRA